MTMSFDYCLDDLRHAEDFQSLNVILESLLARQGIESFLLYDPSRPLSESPIVHKFDEGLVAQFDKQHVWKRDPLSLQTRGRPLIWSAEGRLGEPTQARDLVWDPMTAAGFRHYMAVPVYRPMGGCDVFAILTKDAIRPSGRAGHMLDQLIPIAYHLASFFRPIDGAEGKPNITEREVLCLQWTACGKTAWEVAGILGVTERTANFHLGNAMVKLEAATKIQAVTKAVRLGIIQLQ